MYKIEFAGATVYEGASKEMANMIATAFAHSYNVRGWSQVTLKLSVNFSNSVKAFTGILGRDAIGIVEDFFRHY